jgi:biotin carboxyl carrier protein
VRSEANRAEKRGKLIQAYLEWVEPPLGFDEAQGHSLVHWRGEPEGETIDNLMGALESALGTRRTLPNIIRLIAESTPLDELEVIDVNDEDLIEDPPDERSKGWFGKHRMVSTESVSIEETPAERRWTMIKNSLDHRDYADFIEVFPQEPQAFEARRHKRQLEDWSNIDQSNPAAIEQFISSTDASTQLFGALRGQVFRRAQLIQSEDFKRQQDAIRRQREIELRAIDVVIPTLGESVEEATVGNWFVSSGDHVERDSILCELETDKVAVEVAADATGKIVEISAEEGETVKPGDTIARILPDKN